MTISENDNYKARLDMGNIGKFIQELAKTNLKTTIKTVYLWECHFRQVGKLQEMFTQSGFELR